MKSTNHRLPDSDYYPYFDYLRIGLACLVMFGHDDIVHWQHAGNLAVQVFFALSGWLIGGILLKLESRDLPQFYFNRAIRIWIPYYLALALLLSASLLKDAMTGKWLEFIFYKLSFVYNLFGPPQWESAQALMPLHGTGNHFWSVNAEEQFYLLAPLLLVFVTARFGRHVLTWICLALAAWWLDIYASIVFGVLAAVAVRRWGPLHRSLPARIVLVAVAVAAAAGMADDFAYARLAPLLAVAVVLLAAIPGEQQGFGKFLGGMSYPLYLNHWIGVFVGHALLSPFGLRDSPLRQLLSVVISLAIAAVLYWYVDRRLLAMRPVLFSVARGKTLMFWSYGLVAIGIGGGLLVFRS